jgi:hypothetical protein
MKRLIALLALVTGLAVAGFYGYQQFLPKAQSDDALAYVPADTPFFFGSLQRHDWSAWLRAMPGLNLAPAPEAMAELQEALGEGGAAGGLFFGLYSLYLELIQDPATMSQRFGVRDDELATMYAIGLVPVVRQPLADPAVFLTTLDEAELRGKVSHQVGQFQGEILRRYDFGEGSPFDLIVLVRDDVAIFTLDMPIERDAVLALALGLEKPAQSLADTSLAQEVAKRHGLAPAAVGFINHKSLMAGLTGADASLLARMLGALDEDVGEPLAALRTAGCRRDLQALARQWPMTALGYTRIDAAAGIVDSKLVFAADDERQMREVRKLQGHVPVFRQGQTAPLLAAALGLDVDALAPVVQGLWKQFTTADYQCEFLQAWQQQARQQNPALLALATTMISGVRGVGAAVYDVQLDENVQPESMRAILTVTADDPAALLSRLQMLNPALAAVRIPADGSAVRLPPMFEFMPPLMVAIRGPHIVIYAGPALDDILQALAGESLQANALWWMRVDYARLMPLLSQVFASIAAHPVVSSEEVLAARQQLDQFGELGIAVELGVELAPEGVILHSEGSVNPAAPSL